MPRKSKVKPETVIQSKPETAGFYKKEGEALIFAPTAVYFPDKTSLLISKSSEYTYPVKGWTFYGSREEAYAAEGLSMPSKPLSKRSGTLSNRKMSREERQADRLQREANRISRLEKSNPDLAERVKARNTIREQKVSERLAKLKQFKPSQGDPQAKKPERVASNGVTLDSKVVKLQVFPENPEPYQLFKDLEGKIWQYGRLRDSDGTFSMDDPQTPLKESAFQWLPKGN
jgi:hypothetical protein